MAAAWRGVVALGLLAHCTAFVQPGCPGALAGRGWARSGAKACARPVCSNALRMSEHTEDRCVVRAGAVGGFAVRAKKYERMQDDAIARYEES